MKISRWPLLRWDDGATMVRLTESSINETLLIGRPQIGSFPATVGRGMGVARGMQEGSIAVFAYLDGNGEMDFAFAMNLLEHPKPTLLILWPGVDFHNLFVRAKRSPTQESLDRISVFVYDMLGNPMGPRSYSPEVWKTLEFPVFMDADAGVNARKGIARAAHLRGYLLPAFLAQRVKLADPATYQAGDEEILRDIQAEVFELVTVILNDNLGYCLASHYRPTKDRKRLTSEDGRLFGQSWNLPGHWKDNRRLVLSLKGEPTWTVQQPYGHDRFQIFTTADPAAGPASVLRDSHTVLETEDFDWWLDRLTARSGEPTEMVNLDPEPYELLDTPSPLLWADDAFIDWYLASTT